MQTDFSIRRLLGVQENPVLHTTPFHWLTSNRYNPPRLIRKEKGKRRAPRKTGRTPRVPFTPSQVNTLEERFRDNPYLSCDDAAHLSSLLRLSDYRIKIWFQNRRARERRLKGNDCLKHEQSSPKGIRKKSKLDRVGSAFQPINLTSRNIKCYLRT